MQWVEQEGLYAIEAHGCTVDVKSKRTGKPILKSQTIYTDDLYLTNHRKSHELAPCARGNTAASGFYTDLFNDTIVDGWRHPLGGVTAALPCVREPDIGTEQTYFLMNCEESLSWMILMMVWVMCVLLRNVVAFRKPRFARRRHSKVGRLQEGGGMYPCGICRSCGDHAELSNWCLICKENAICEECRVCSECQKWYLDCGKDGIGKVMSTDITEVPQALLPRCSVCGRDEPWFFVQRRCPQQGCINPWICRRLGCRLQHREDRHGGQGEFGPGWRPMCMGCYIPFNEDDDKFPCEVCYKHWLCNACLVCGWCESRIGQRALGMLNMEGVT